MQKSQRKIGIILSYITLAVQLVMGFVYVPMYIKYLGPSENGIYQLMGAFSAYLSIMDFGLSSTIIRYYSKYKALDEKKNMENVLSLSALIYGFITIIIVAVGTGLYMGFGDIFTKLTPAEIISAKRVLLVVIVNIAVSIPSKIFNAVIISNEKFMFLKMLTLMQAILQPFFVIAVLLNTPTAFAVVLAQTTVNIIIIASQVFYCFVKLKVRIRFNSIDKKLFKSILRFSVFTFIGALMDQLFWQSNNVILGKVSGTMATGIYGSAMTIFLNYQSLSTVITSVFLPNVTAMVAAKATTKQLTDLMIRIGRIQSLLLSCVLSGFIVFGQQFINLWLGEGYESAYLIIVFLIAPITIDLVQNIGITILQAANKVAFRSVSFLIVAVVSIMVAIPVATKFGGVGAALVTGIGCIVSNIILNVFYKTKMKLGIGLFWKEISKIFIYSTVCGLIGAMLNFLPLPYSYFGLIVKALIYVLVFVIGLWLFIMNDYEKGLIRNVLGKVFHSKKEIET